MKYLKILLFVLMFIAFINVVNGGSWVQGNKYYATGYGINLTSQHNSLANQIIYNIPSSELLNINYIDTIKFTSGRSFGTVPNSNLLVRIYKGNNGTYIYQDSYSINYTYCNDNLGCQISISLDSPIYLTHNSFINDSLAIGYYTENTLGMWRLMADLNQYMGIENYKFYNWNTHSYSGNIGYVTDVNGNQIYNNYYGESKLITFSYIDLYGSFVIPQTPIPQPTVLEPCSEGCTTPIPAPNGTIPDLPSPLGEFNFTNFTKPDENCSNCQGNETKETKKGISKTDTGFGKTFSKLGYCNSDKCTIDDLIDFAYDFSVGFFLISFIFLVSKMR